MRLFKRKTTDERILEVVADVLEGKWGTSQMPEGCQLMSASIHTDAFRYTTLTLDIRLPYRGS